MLAILGGLGAASAWAAATLCSSRSTRMIGASPVLAWVMIVGLVVLAPVLVVGPGPGDLSRTDLAWLVCSGIGNAGGLLLVYHGLSIGKVGVVAPIASTEGAITAVIAILAGESMSSGVGAMLVLIVAGIVLSARPPEDGPERGSTDHRDARVAVLCGIGAALSFGVSLYGVGRLSGDVPAAWLLLPARMAGVLAVALPLVLTGRLRLTRAAVPFVVVSGLCEVLGFVAFTIGAQHGIAIAAVLASQFAALAAVVAYFAFGERLARLQVAGVAAIVAGVAMLSLLQA